MDIESYAARAALEPGTGAVAGGGKDQNVALFQIGAQVTNVSVLRNGETIYKREQPFGGNQLTQDIVRAYGMTSRRPRRARKRATCRDNYDGRSAAPVPGERRAGNHARDAVLLHLDPVHPASTRSCWPAAARRSRAWSSLVASRTQIATRVAVPFNGMQIAPSVREQQLRQEARGLPGRLRPGACGGSADDPDQPAAAPRAKAQAEARPPSSRCWRWAASSASRSCWRCAATTPPHLDPGTSATRLLKSDNAELDKKIDEINKLKDEIEALKARQQAVETCRATATSRCTCWTNWSARSPKAST